MIMRIVPKGNKSSKSPSRDADIDYAAAADLLAGVEASVDDESNSDKDMSVASDEGSDDAGGSESDDNNIEENSDDDGENDDDNDSENDRDNGDEEIDNSDGDSEASSDDDDDGDEEEDDEDEDDEALVRNPPATNNIRIASTNGEPCTYDLRNLLAVNSHQINAEVLYSKTTPAKPDSVTIPWTGGELVPNEDYLLEKAVDGCSQLISALWQLPVERSDAGPLVQLPAYDESRVPRSLVRYCMLQEIYWVGVLPDIYSFFGYISLNSLIAATAAA